MLKLKINSDGKVYCPACNEAMYKSAFKSHSFAKAKNEAFLRALGHKMSALHLLMFKSHSVPEPIEPKVRLAVNYER